MHITIRDHFSQVFQQILISCNDKTAQTILQTVFINNCTNKTQTVFFNYSSLLDRGGGTAICGLYRVCATVKGMVFMQFTLG